MTQAEVGLQNCPDPTISSAQLTILRSKILLNFEHRCAIETDQGRIQARLSLIRGGFERNWV